MKTALIDADIIMYRSSILTEDQEQEEAIRLADDMILSWMSAADAEGHLCCLSSQLNFRKVWWPEYKQNRKDKPRPKHLSAVLEHIKSKHPYVVHPEWEADDVIGFLHTHPLCVDTVIVTIDKDLDQIPGRHCNPDKEENYTVLPDDAETYRWCQVLSGDTTDNYPGIRGIGHVKAMKILEDAAPGDYESIVRQVYTEKGHDEAFYNSMLACATIIKFTKEIECDLLSQDTTTEHTLPAILKSLHQFS